MSIRQAQVERLDRGDLKVASPQLNILCSSDAVCDRLEKGPLNWKLKDTLEKSVLWRFNRRVNDDIESVTLHSAEPKEGGGSTPVFKLRAKSGDFYCCILDINEVEIHKNDDPFFPQLKLTLVKR